MSGCINCGAPTPNRKCRECQLMDRAEEAARAEIEAETETDSGSRYTRATGEGYAGTFTVGSASTEVNMVSVGVARGTDLRIHTSDAHDVPTARITTRARDPDGDLLEKTEVRENGYLSVLEDTIDHLGVDVGDRIRLYRDGAGAFELVPADADPFVSDAGEERELVTDGGAPLYHSKPTERRDRADSHFCKAVGHRRYCHKTECDLCGDDQEVDGLLTDGGEEMEPVHYHAVRVGRPTRTAEVQAGDGTNTIEEGTLTAELCLTEDLETTIEDDGWIAHYVAPDGGVGFNGVSVPYDLVEIIPLPEPMPEDEAWDYVDDEWLKQIDEMADGDGNVDISNADWWACPDCGGDTTVEENVRSCENCEWSYEIPMIGDDVDRGEGIETDGGRERKFEPEDHVLVENLDGERKDAVVVGYHDTTAGEHELFADDSDRSTTTLARYWGDVDEDEPVVAIRYAKGVSWDGRVQTWSVQTYDFPESAIVKPETDGGQTQLGDADPFGIADLAVGDELKVTYDSPHSDYEQIRRGEVVEIGDVTDDSGPTGATEIVLNEPRKGDLTLWPAWDEVRSSGARIGEVIDVERINRDEDQPRLAADGGTPRYKIAERVASAVRDTAERELRRRAGSRLTDQEIADLAEWIEQQTRDDVNGTLKVQAAEEHGHDLAPDGGLPESLDEFADPRTDDDRECESCGDEVPRRFLEGGKCIGCRKREDPTELRADGYGAFCAACCARVAREDRVTVNGQVYHRQCAPDESAYSEEVPR